MAEWRNKITIKEKFEDETTPELVEDLCISLIIQLNNIKTRELQNKINPVSEEIQNLIVDSLDECIDHFEFLQQLSNGSIPEDKFDDYGFDGDHEEMFNSYLQELYDLGDKAVATITGKIQKFIWVG
jgi:hypothetical protein